MQKNGMFTITTRLTLWYLLSFGSIVSAIVLVLYMVFASNERATFDAELRDYAEFLVSQARATSSVSDLYDNLQDVTAQANLRFRSMRFLLTTQDSVVYEATPEESTELLADSLQTMHPRRTGGRFRTIEVNGVRYRAFAMPVPNAAADALGMGMVVVASLDRLEASLSRLREILLIIIPTSLLLASIGGWFTARRALAPVSEITAAAAAISSSNLHKRVSGGRSGDELSELADTFNAMIERLERTFSSQRRFVADASHDLRTPLMVIQAKLDRLARHDGLDQSARHDIDLCSSEVERLSRLASDLLLLARADADQLRMITSPQRLDEILIDCVAKLKTLASAKRISLWVNVDEPVEVVCDPRAIERALMNVLDNAILYSHESSTVSAAIAAADGIATITIADTGPGIAPGDLPLVFDRFYRSDAARSTGGTGLGLSITKTIIEAHGGTIALASEPGRGTTVRIGLPVS
jgi:signal transduction histidine kinase